METVKFYVVDDRGFYNIYEFSIDDAQLFKEYAEEQIEQWGYYEQMHQWSVQDSKTFLNRCLEDASD